MCQSCSNRTRATAQIIYVDFACRDQDKCQMHETQANLFLLTATKSNELLKDLIINFVSAGPVIGLPLCSHELQVHRSVVKKLILDAKIRLFT